MDLTGMIQNPVEDQNSEQKLSKEEYAALKKQEREETWMQIDGQAQSVFKDGASLQKFLDFMAGQYNMPKVSEPFAFIFPESRSKAGKIF